MTWRAETELVCFVEWFWLCGMMEVFAVFSKLWCAHSPQWQKGMQVRNPCQCAECQAAVGVQWRDFVTSPKPEMKVQICKAILWLLGYKVCANSPPKRCVLHRARRQRWKKCKGVKAGLRQTYLNISNRSFCAKSHPVLCKCASFKTAPVPHNTEHNCKQRLHSLVHAGWLSSLWRADDKVWWKHYSHTHIPYHRYNIDVFDFFRTFDRFILATKHIQIILRC